MHRRPITKFHPALEQFEEKQLLSTGALASHRGEATVETPALAAEAAKQQSQLPTKFLAFRITNTSQAQI